MDATFGWGGDLHRENQGGQRLFPFERVGQIGQAGEAHAHGIKRIDAAKDAESAVARKKALHGGAVGKGQDALAREGFGGFRIGVLEQGFVVRAAEGGALIRLLAGGGGDGDQPFSSLGNQGAAGQPVSCGRGKSEEEDGQDWPSHAHAPLNPGNGRIVVKIPENAGVAGIWFGRSGRKSGCNPACARGVRKARRVCDARFDGGAGMD